MGIMTRIAKQLVSFSGDRTNSDYYKLSRWEPWADFTEKEQQTAAYLMGAGEGFSDRTNNYSVQSPESIATTMRAVDYLCNNNIPGAFVECGVYWACSQHAMIAALSGRTSEHLRELWLYDTFAGMPKPEEHDRARGEPDGAMTFQYWKKNNGRESDHPNGEGSDWVFCPLDKVKELLRSTQYPDEYLKFVKGKVENTVPALMPAQVALLRLDTDYYTSIKHSLQHFYPRMSSGGIVIIDDYNAFVGAKKAVDEFTQGKQFLSRVDEHVVMWVKP